MHIHIYACFLLHVRLHIGMTKHQTCSLHRRHACYTGEKVNSTGRFVVTIKYHLTYIQPVTEFELISWNYSNRRRIPVDCSKTSNTRSDTSPISERGNGRKRKWTFREVCMYMYFSTVRLISLLIQVGIDFEIKLCSMELPQQKRRTRRLLYKI